MLERYDATGDPDVRPGDVTFNSVIHAISNDPKDRVDAPRRAMRLLEMMESMSLGGGGGTKPNIISYNSVLNAFAKSGGGPQSARRAEEMLNRLEDSYDKSRRGEGKGGDIPRILQRSSRGGLGKG